MKGKRRGAGCKDLFGCGTHELASSAKIKPVVHLFTASYSVSRVNVGYINSGTLL
jgi:hypothetical protein